MSSLVSTCNIVNWVTTADDCVHIAELDSFVASASCVLGITHCVSGVLRNLKGSARTYILGVHFQKVQKLAHFCHITF